MVNRETYGESLRLLRKFLIQFNMKKLLLSIIVLLGFAPLYASIVIVDVNTSGTLQTILGSDIETIDSIKLSGNLNTYDVLVLKKMTVSYKLIYIDLYDASAPIGSNAFEGSNGIKQIILPQNCTSIGYLAFAHCSNLEKIILGKKVQSLENGCLRGCGKLKEIVLPKTVSSIGTQCFDGGTCFNDIYCEGSNPPSASTNAWGYFGSVVHVPIGSKNAYQFANGWMNFENIVEYQVANTHTLSYEIVGEGRIYINGEHSTGGTINIDNDEKTLLYFEPNEGWEFDKVKVNGKDLTNNVNGNELLLEPTEDNVSMSVSFKKKPVFIHLQLTDKGSLIQKVEYGTKLSFKIEVFEEWKINTVIYNGYDVTSELNGENEYTTPAIYADATLSVSFESTQTAVNSARVSNAKVYASNGQIIVAGVESGNMISVYDESGKAIAQTITTSKEHRLSIQSKGIYIVKVEGKTVKVSL